MQKWIPIVGAVVVWSGGPQAAGAQETAAKLFYPPSDAGAEITAALKAAKADRRHVLLDFGADWCLPCREMDRTTFRDPAVVRAAEPFVPLKVDVTADDADANAVMSRFGVAGVPTYVVLRPDGSEHERLVGFVPAARMREVLETLAPRAAGSEARG